MAGQDTSAFSAVLKDFYEGELNSNINENVRAWKLHEKRTKEWEGNQVVLAIKSRRSWGAGASANAVLPVARAVQSVKLTVSDKALFGRIQVEERVMQKSRTNLGSFARAVRVEIEGMEETLIRSANRQCFGIGNGKLCEISSANNTTKVVTIRTTGGTGYNGNAGARYIHPDMFLEIRVGTTGSSTRVDTVRVQSVDYDNNTFTANSDADLSAVTAGDSVYILIASGTCSQNNEIMGWGGLVDDGTYVETIEGQSRTTYPILKAAAQGNPASLANFTTNQLQRLLDLIYNNSGDPKIAMFLCHTGVREEVAKVLQVYHRYMKVDDQGLGIKESLTDTNLESTVTYNDIPFVVDRDCPYYTIFAINPESIKNYVLQDFKWGDMDGAVLSRVPGYAAYEAFMSWYGNLGSANMNKNGVLRGVNQTVASGMIPS